MRKVRAEETSDPNFSRRILDCFWCKRSGGRNSKGGFEKYLFLQCECFSESALTNRQSQIPKVYPFMGAVNLKSKIQNLKLINFATSKISLQNPQFLMMLQTEFPFVLPQGYVDPEGNIHREGTMRLSTAYDEIMPLRDPRVQANPGYLVIILLSRVITHLGTLQQINPKLIEGLFSGDLVYLQDLYQRINQNNHTRLLVTCPHCQGEFEVETSPVGE